MKFAITCMLFLYFHGVFAQMWLVDPLEPIYPDVNNTDNYSSKLKQDVAQGVLAEAHILVKLPIGEIFTVTALKDGKVVEKGTYDKLSKQKTSVLCELMSELL